MTTRNILICESPTRVARALRTAQLAARAACELLTDDNFELLSQLDDSVTRTITENSVARLGTLADMVEAGLVEETFNPVANLSMITQSFTNVMHDGLYAQLLTLVLAFQTPLKPGEYLPRKLPNRGPFHLLGAHLRDSDAAAMLMLDTIGEELCSMYGVLRGNAATFYTLVKDGWGLEDAASASQLVQTSER